MRKASLLGIAAAFGPSRHFSDSVVLFSLTFHQGTSYARRNSLDFYSKQRPPKLPNILSSAPPPVAMQVWCPATFESGQR